MHIVKWEDPVKERETGMGDGEKERKRICMILILVSIGSLKRKVCVYIV